MGPREIMYDINSILLAALLLLAMAVAMRLGRMVGKKSQRHHNDESKSQVGAVQGSLLGLLALLLGFTFSLALNRYDDRSRAVVSEANAIGTAWLRTDLLSDARRDEAKALMSRYGTIRYEAGRVPASEPVRRAELVGAAEEIFDKLWQVASAEVQEVGGPAAVSMTAALNDMIDALGERDAAIERHVPELVLFLMFATFVLLGSILGYSSGLTAVKAGFPVYAMLILIVALVFVIIDLDRPRRGLIEVNQQPLFAITNTMSEAVK
ncbi:bestrophin-like domain [Litoreibacter albidus]|uniref:bestrophin-like domain n=1 Tax=Litoreibacter albidus TaxID=670155 RepID=UPI003735C155